MHSEPVAPRTALAPQRQHGKRRVASLLAAAAAVFGERGFEAATMAEIAARAGAPIGSLYRFFPNKDALADALFDRYAERLALAFAALDGGSAPRSLDLFADALLNVMTDLRGEKVAIVPLLDAHANGSKRRQEFHDTILRHIAEALRRRGARLSDADAGSVATVLLQNLKAMSALRSEPDELEANAGAIGELREMTRLYLASKLGEN